MESLPWDMIGVIIGGLSFLLTLLVDWKELGKWRRVIVALVIGAVVFFIVSMIVPLIFPPSTSQTTPDPSNNGNAFSATLPITIDGTSYPVPTLGSPTCVARQQTGDALSAVEYELSVPKGWFVAWGSEKAHWPGGSYTDDGLLQVYGNWQGKITIINGGYCAVPVEWKVFALYTQSNANPKAGRPQFSIGELP
jgi:hypothetical protein